MIRDLLTKASISVEATQILIEDACIDDAVSRAYYAMFNTARALILLADPHVNLGGSHGSVTAAFSRHIVKTGMLPKRWGALINEVQTARHAADYGEEGIAVAEAAEYLAAARELLAFALARVPPDQVPAAPVSPRERVFEDRIREAVRDAMAEVLCTMMERRGACLPPGVRRELVLYAEEADLRALVLSVHEMEDARSFIASRVALPAFG